MKYIFECPECGYIKDCSSSIFHIRYAEYLNSHCIGIFTRHVTSLIARETLQKYERYYESRKGFHKPVKMNILEIEDKLYESLAANNMFTRTKKPPS